jgi:endonuclease/exonuclease/phosphatase family metal-dependent hydrolase
MEISTVSPRRSGSLFVVSMLVTSVVALHPLPAFSAGKPRPVPVETRNLYLGADLTPAFLAQNPVEFVLATSEIWLQVVATDFPARAQTLAAEIDEASPLLVGLQEVALWRTGAPDGPPILGGTPATNVVYDFLALLLDALAERGLTYDAVVVQQEADLEAPTVFGFDVRLTQRDVILAKAVGKGALTLTNPQSANYAANLQVTVAGGLATAESTRGWTSIDVTAKQRQFRFVNTHLEAFSNFYRSEQASELLAGPLATSLPVVLVGDLNSAPDDPIFDEPFPIDAFNETNPYDILTASRFVDTWALLHPQDPGFTCCNEPDLLNPVPTLFQRIDYVLMRGGTAYRSKVIGTDPDNRTPEGLWPSDHAGVTAATAP